MNNIFLEKKEDRYEILQTSHRRGFQAIIR